MKQNKITAFLAMFFMAAIILDSKTALFAANQAVEFSLQTLIPTLLPFLFLSALLANTNLPVPCSSVLCKLLRIPRNSSGLFLLGLVSGYPAGAQAIASAYSQKQLSKSDAERMILFCNNAGPAFIFGFGSTIFGSVKLCFVLWLIQISGAILTGSLLPGKPEQSIRAISAPQITLPAAMRRGIITTGMICGWVICFRILLTFLSKWALFLLPKWMKSVVYGILELSNGCESLMNLSLPGLKMQLFSTFLGIGGLCVGMQTATIVQSQGLSMKLYWPGKLLQGCVCFLLTIPAQQLLLPEARWKAEPVSIIIVLSYILFTVYFLHNNKKMVAFQRNMLYNEEKIKTRGTYYAVSKEN